MLIARRPAGPAWKPVMGARMLFAPIDRVMLRRARKAALAALGRDEHEGAVQASAAEQLEELGDALSLALITAGLQDWQDVQEQLLGEDGEPVLEEGEPVFRDLPFTVENVAIVLSDPITFEAVDAAYVVPFAGRERAKNGSAASPTGTGEAATPAADTASSPATLPSTADAPSAPTVSTPPAKTKRKVSGKS